MQTVLNFKTIARNSNNVIIFFWWGIFGAYYEILNDFHYYYYLLLLFVISLFPGALSTHSSCSGDTIELSCQPCPRGGWGKPSLNQVNKAPNQGLFLWVIGGDGLWRTDSLEPKSTQDAERHQDANLVIYCDRPLSQWLENSKPLWSAHSLPVGKSKYNHTRL